MLISVVTVCFNSSKTISHTLESFLSQTYPSKELLVIDGGSTDGTVELVQRLQVPEIRMISEPDQGIYDAMNKGLRQFQGDAVGFLNSDDKFNNPRSLEHIAASLAEFDCAHGHLRYVSSHESLETVRLWRASPRPRSGFKSGWVPSHPTFYCRAHIAKKVGLFDTSLKISADYDWMLRAIELHNASIGQVDEVLVDMMVGGASTESLRARVQGNIEKLRSRQTNLGAPFLDYATIAMPLSKIKQVLRLEQPLRN